jgi:L-fucose isomerase-like protein
MMEKTRIGFIVFGVHKDGLADPMAAPFIDPNVVAGSVAALKAAGLQPVEADVVISTKQEARACLDRFKKMDDVQAIVLFSGTWIWAAHLTAALRDFSRTGKGIVLWTHPGSQGWRTVGSLVLHGALEEIGIPHRVIYGDSSDPGTIQSIVSYCRASHLKNSLNMTTAGIFGGRGMGQTCGQADPAQWMRVFDIDIDTRDSIQLLATAESVSAEELAKCRARVQQSFKDQIPRNSMAERSLRLLAAIDIFVTRERWDFYSIQSFPGVAEAYSATCLAQSMMLEWGVPTSTLGDMNTLMSVIVLMSLSAERVYYGDLQNIDRMGREIKIIGDGACPPSLAGSVGPARFAEHGIPTEGAAGGLSVDLVCKAGEGVLARMGRARGELEMVLCRCSVNEPGKEAIRQRREECHIPFWPHAFVTVDCDMEALIQSWNNEYAVLGYGAQLYGQVSDFCALSGIKLVAL